MAASFRFRIQKDTPLPWKTRDWKGFSLCTWGFKPYLLPERGSTFKNGRFCSISYPSISVDSSDKWLITEFTVDQLLTLVVHWSLICPTMSWCSKFDLKFGTVQSVSALSNENQSPGHDHHYFCKIPSTYGTSAWERKWFKESRFQNSIHIIKCNSKTGIWNLEPFIWIYKPKFICWFFSNPRNAEKIMTVFIASRCVHG